MATKTRRVLRSKTFTTHRDGVLQPGFKAAYKFRKARPKSSDAWMESYGVGKGRKISRAVVYYYKRKKVN